MYIHKPLPLPTLQQLAAGVDPPADDVQSAIVAAAAVHVDSNGQVDPYWVHAEAHQSHPDVTIGQVARVLLDRGLAS